MNKERDDDVKGKTLRKLLAAGLTVSLLAGTVPALAAVPAETAFSI